jgi:ribosome-binding protein aMBF1 (putative translation factor)
MARNGKKTAAASADMRRIAGAAWSDDCAGILVSFATGERFLLPLEGLAEADRIARGGELVVEQDGFELRVALSGGGSGAKLGERGYAEISWDFVRHECDARFRARQEARARACDEAVGARVAAARRSAGLTQEALSEASAVPRITLARVESGAVSPSFPTLEKLAGGLGMTLIELLDFKPLIRRAGNATGVARSWKRPPGPPARARMKKRKKSAPPRRAR